MKTELNPEDRERIEQAAYNYGFDVPTAVKGFKAGAEYENKYQREQHATREQQLVEALREARELNNWIYQKWSESELPKASEIHDFNKKIESLLNNQP